MAREWDLEIGDITTRREVMERFGGSRFGGIQPSRRSPNVLIYSDPSQGEQHGYNFDGWDPGPRNAVYYYTGEGQLGDQDPEAKGNGAILRHLDSGRALRLFEAAGGSRSGGKPQKYIGEFRLDSADPWEFREAPDRQGDPRSVVVFRLLALTPAQSRAESRAGIVDLPARSAREFDERHLREVAMRWLEVRTDGARHALTAEDLKDFDGGYPLVDQAADLWQPAGFTALFSIRAVVDATDNVTANGMMLASPGPQFDPAIEAAKAQRLPLVWFQGIGNGQYLPIFPLYVVGKAGDSFLLSADETFGRIPEAPESALEVALKRYAIAETKRRLHQPLFRANVLRAYGRRCAVCALAHVELLDAAHIVADSDELGIPVVQNGLALCKLHHSAYDARILGIRPDYTVEIAARVLSEVDGPMLKHGLQERHGERLMVLPALRHEWPDIDLIGRQYEQFKMA